MSSPAGGGSETELCAAMAHGLAEKLKESYSDSADELSDAEL